MKKLKISIEKSSLTGVKNIESEYPFCSSNNSLPDVLLYCIDVLYTIQHTKFRVYLPMTKPKRSAQQSPQFF